MPSRLLVTLALLCATAPISTDLYLASFPEMAHGLRTDASMIQLTLTAFLVGIGTGQVLWGPVSDRVGRYRPMIFGASVALIASVVAMPDLLKQATQAQALTANPSPLIGAAVIYIAFLWPMVIIVARLEKRFSAGRRR